MASYWKQPTNATLEVQFFTEKKDQDYDNHYLLLRCHLYIFRELSLNFIPYIKEIKDEIEKDADRVGDKDRGDYKDPWRLSIRKGYIEVVLWEKAYRPPKGFHQIPRGELCDYLVNEGWEMMAMSTGPDDTLVEKWIKKSKASTEELDNEEQPPEKKTKTSKA